MLIDMQEAARIRRRKHVVEIEDQHLLDYPRKDVLEALAESYFYMVAHEFPGFHILGEHMASTVWRDIDHNITQIAVWWSPPTDACFFPELGYGYRAKVPVGSTLPRISVEMLKPPGFPDLTNAAVEMEKERYYLEGWSDTFHAWIYKKGK